MTAENHNSSNDPETLQGSIDLLKHRIQIALDNASHYASAQAQLESELQSYKQRTEAELATMRQERDEALAEHKRMSARLERIISRLRLMGLEQSHYE